MTSPTLWEKYKKTRDKKIKEQLIIDHIELVKIIAGRLYGSYKNNVDFDDLVGYGIFGLLDAIEKFDPSKNVKFDTYAYIRIRGAIIDQLRSLDWIPRSVRQKYKRVEEAYKNVENSNGRSASDREVADYLGITVEELQRTLSEIHSFSVVSLDEKLANNPSFTLADEDADKEPQKHFEKEEMKIILKDLVNDLPEKERTVISLYYNTELTYKEISLVIGVSESRISQIHTKAIVKLRTKLEKFL